MTVNLKTDIVNHYRPYLPACRQGRKHPYVQFSLISPSGEKKRFRFHLDRYGFRERNQLAAHVVAITNAALALGQWPPHFQKPKHSPDWIQRWLDFLPAQIEAFPPATVGTTVAAPSLSDSIRPADQVTSGGISLEDLIGRALSIKKSVVARKSHMVYTTAAERLLDFAADQDKLHLRPAVEFDQAMAGAFLAKLLEAGIGPKTHNNYRLLCSALFSEALSAGLLPETAKNPFTGTRMRKVKGKDRDLLTDLERKAITQYLSQHDDRLLLVCELIYYCFIRPVEICRLRIRDIHLDRGEIQLVASRAKSRGRVVAIPEVFMPRMQALKLEQYHPDWLLLSDAAELKPGPSRMYPQTMSIRLAERFKRMRETIGIRPEVKLYSFKDTGADAARRAGLDIKEISEQMGHATLNETDHYLRPITGRVGSRFAEKMPEL